MYAYDDIIETCSPRSALQKVTAYVYDALVLPYLAHTYTTTTTLIVITGAYRSASAPTTATAHRNRHKRKSGNKQAIYSIGSSQPAVFGQQPAVSSQTYYAFTTTCDNLTAPTPTTTNTTAIINIYPANQSPPTTHLLDYYYGYRYYSPELGRWPSRDPILENGRLTVAEHHAPTSQVANMRLKNEIALLIMRLLANANRQIYAEAGATVCLDSKAQEFEDMVSEYRQDMESIYLANSRHRLSLRRLEHSTGINDELNMLGRYVFPNIYIYVENSSPQLVDYLGLCRQSYPMCPSSAACIKKGGTCWPSGDIGIRPYPDGSSRCRMATKSCECVDNSSLPHE